jgi:hypothetical protein
MKHKFIMAVVLTGILACPPWAGAAGGVARPSADRPLPEMGTLTAVYPDKQLIVVGDTVFQLLPYTQVRTSSGSATSIENLKIGTTINFATTGQKQSGRYVITQIQATAN